MEADLDPLSAMSLCVDWRPVRRRSFVGGPLRLTNRAAESTEVLADIASTKQTAQMAIDAGVAERDACMADRAAGLIATAFEESIGEEELAAERSGWFLGLVASRWMPRRFRCCTQGRVTGC
jgi:hypothetical protein